MALIKITGTKMNPTRVALAVIMVVLLIAGLVIDHFGLLGLDYRLLTNGRIIGAIMLIVGIILILFS